MRFSSSIKIASQTIWPLYLMLVNNEYFLCRSGACCVFVCNRLNYSKIESEFANFSLTVRFVRCLCLKRSVMWKSVHNPLHPKGWGRAVYSTTAVYFLLHITEFLTRHYKYKTFTIFLLQKFCQKMMGGLALRAPSLKLPKSTTGFSKSSKAWGL